jgi:hypothetical protein
MGADAPKPPFVRCAATPAGRPRGGSARFLEDLPGTREVIIRLKPGFAQSTNYKPGSIFQMTFAIAINNRSGKICDRFSFQIRSAIFKSQSQSRSRSKTVPEKLVIDFHSGIDQRFSDQNRDHDRDRKLIRKNRSAFFISKSMIDFQIKIGSGPVPYFFNEWRGLNSHSPFSKE